MSSASPGRAGWPLRRRRHAGHVTAQGKGEALQAALRGRRALPLRRPCQQQMTPLGRWPRDAQWHWSRAGGGAKLHQGGDPARGGEIKQLLSPPGPLQARCRSLASHCRLERRGLQRVAVEKGENTCSGAQLCRGRARLSGHAASWLMAEQAATYANIPQAATWYDWWPFLPPPGATSCLRICTRGGGVTARTWGQDTGMHKMGKRIGFAIPSNSSHRPHGQHTGPWPHTPRAYSVT